MGADIDSYNAAQTRGNRVVCEALASLITSGLPGAEGRVWHGGAVWFLGSNPVVGYWVRKVGVQVLFWSGQDFHEVGLRAEGKFRAAQVVYGDVGQIDAGDMQRWLGKAAVIQWDYGNIVKRRGRLEKLGEW